MNKRIIIVVSISLLSLIGVRLFFLQNKTKSFKVENDLNRVSSVDFNRETITLELEHQQTELQKILDEYQNSVPVASSSVVIDLNDHVRATANADDQFVAASLYKLFVAYAVYDKIDRGEITYEQKVPNSSFTVKACLQAMIAASDNECGFELGNLVDWTQLDQKLQNEGYTDTKLDNYDEKGDLDGDKKTSARDVAQLLYNLYQGRLVSPESREHFLTILNKQQRDDRLPQGLPQNTDIAHKTGELEDHRHDAGLITEGENQYIAVMLTAGWENPSQEAPPIFRDFS